MDVSIVIPIYRSEQSLPELVARIATVCDKLDRTTELVLVDDGSPDNSWRTICELREQYPNFVVGVQLMRNYGQHNAVMCGFRHAHGATIVTLDDDLQNPPEEIPRLLDEFAQVDADVLYAIPKGRRDPIWRRMASQPVQLFVQKAIGLPGPVSAFRVLRKTVTDAAQRYELNYTFVDGLLAWNTQRVHYSHVEHHARANGQSGYSIRRLFFHALNIVTNFSLVPLQVASGFGLLASTVGLAMGAFFLLQALLSNIAVPGYASTIVAVMTLGGLQLLALGIIGEYVGRLHLNMNRKPQYTIRQVLSAAVSDQKQIHVHDPDNGNFFDGSEKLAG